MIALKLRWAVLAKYDQKVNTMKKLNSSLVLGAALTALSGQAVAELRVVVTPTKTEKPAETVTPNVAVISAQDIERIRPEDLPSLLNRATGLDFRDSGGRGSASGVFIRGTAPSQQIVLVDGVRVGSATTGAAALSNIPVEVIDRIEVVKGPMSGLYGADAVGGVIQIFTKQGTQKETAISRVTFGSNGFKEFSQTLSDNGENYQVFANINREETRGIDRTTDLTGGNDDKDGFEETSGNFSIGYDITKNTQAKLNYLWANADAEFDNTFGADADRHTKTESNVGGLQLRHKIEELLVLSAAYGHTEDKTSNFNNTSPQPTKFDTQRETAELKADLKVADGINFVTGVDYYKDEVTSSTNYPEDERDNVGGFASAQFDFGIVSSVISGRYDDNEAYGHERSGSAQFGLHISEAFNVAASYGEAFVAPSFNDLYFPNFGNPDIQPEESETVELSFYGKIESISWSVAAYKTEVENLIGFTFVPFQAANVAVADIEGYEAEISWQGNTLFASLGVDYVEARNDQTKAFLDDRAKANANAEVGYAGEQFTVSAALDSEHGREDAGTTLPGFAVLDLSAAYQATPKLKFSANVNNVLDKEYVTNVANSFANNFYRNEGRTFKGSLTYSF